MRYLASLSAHLITLIVLFTATTFAVDSPFKPLIVGGTEAHVEEYPWVTGIRLYPEVGTVCGGSLISPKHILTAASCYVWRGEYASIGSRFAEGLKDGERIRIVRQYIHPHFNEETLENDIMILELVNASSYKPVELDHHASPDFFKAGEEARVLGWGLTTENGKASPLLMQADLSIMNHKECKEIVLPDKLTVAEKTLCTTEDQGKATCFGDSGGPLIIKNKVVGISSFVGCGEPKLPGVYTQVGAYLDFIYEIIPSLKQ